MQTEDVQELLLEEIRDLYDAEKQLVKALPKMKEACQTSELAEAIGEHLEETKGQVERLEKVFQLLEKPARGKECKAMKGLLAEGSEAMEKKEAGMLRDVAMIGGAERVEHYEMAAYGSARVLAEHLGHEEVASLLGESEAEEQAAADRLMELAQSILEGTGEDSEEATEEKAAPPARRASKTASAR